MRSPLRNPASSHGRHQTTELNFVLIHYRREEIEAGSRSPLHNPASTHGRHKKTAELKLILIHFLPISMTKITERVWLLLICRLYKSSLEIFVVPISGLAMAMSVPRRIREPGKRAGPEFLTRRRHNRSCRQNHCGMNKANQCTIWSCADRKWNEELTSSAIKIIGEARTQNAP